MYADRQIHRIEFKDRVEGAGSDLVALVVSGTTTLELRDLHGDVIATATTSTSAPGPSSTFESDEFGVPRPGSPFTRYSWLGAKERRTELASGAIAMGVRLYVPQLGRFAQTDPVPGGSANDYDYVNQDPLHRFDLDGRSVFKDAAKWVKKHPLKVIGGTVGAVTGGVTGVVERASQCLNKAVDPSHTPYKKAKCKSPKWWATGK